MSVGSSQTVARLSTATDSDPVCRPEGSITRMGRVRKKVKGSEFWTITVTPVSSVSPARTRTTGGFTR